MDVRDLVIIGSGPAGCSAAIYARRALLDVVVVEKGDWGGQIVSSSSVENYPGVKTTDGYSLMQAMREQAESFGAKFISAEARSLERTDDGLFKIVSDGMVLGSRALIACMGASPSRAGFKGEAEFTGRGVSYCATCDGLFYRNKQVFVCGGGNSAFEEALFLSRFASKVCILIRRDVPRADAALVRQAEAAPSIELRYRSQIVSVDGGELLSTVVIRDDAQDRITTHEFEEGSVGVFVYAGMKPNTELLDGLATLDENSCVVTDDCMRTSTQGLFAAGDCRAGVLRQVVTAASDGAVASFYAAKYLSERKSR